MRKREKLTEAGANPPGTARGDTNEEIEERVQGSVKLSNGASVRSEVESGAKFHCELISHLDAFTSTVEQRLVDAKLAVKTGRAPAGVVEKVKRLLTFLKRKKDRTLYYCTLLKPDQVVFILFEPATGEYYINANKPFPGRGSLAKSNDV